MKLELEIMQHKIELFVIIVGSAITGTLAPFGAKIAQMEVPLIVMQLFQLLSYSTAIIVGLVTLYKFYKNKK